MTGTNQRGLAGHRRDISYSSICMQECDTIQFMFLKDFSDFLWRRDSVGWGWGEGHTMSGAIANGSLD